MEDYAVQRLTSRPIPVDVFLERWVDVPRFLSCCRQCGNYGERWSCPPYDFQPEDWWRRFDHIVLEGRKLCFSQAARDSRPLSWGIEALGREKDALLEELLARESGGSQVLAAGACSLCPVCARREGALCRQRDRMRYSIESLGGDVVSIARECFQTELLWSGDGRLPAYYFLVGGMACPAERS